MRSVLAAVGLLTRIPVGEAAWDDSEMARSVAWMPLVGALVGLFVATSYALLGLVIPAPVAASIAIALGIVVTGALHEDGLADTADAFGAGRDREEVLQIMKDPSHGSYGVIALVISIVVRTASLAALGGTAALVSLPVIHALSRGGAVGLAGLLPAARLEGLGAAHSRPLKGWLAAGWLSALLLGALLIGPALVWFVVVTLLGAVGVAWLSMRRIGGQTGDVLGAAEQTVEILLYIVAVGLAQARLLQTVWWA